MTRMTTAAALCAATCALALAPSDARAQSCADSTIDITIQLSDEDGQSREVQPAELVDFFNLANCVCGTKFDAELHLPSGSESFNEDGDVWVGTDCDDAIDLAARELACENVHTFSDIVDDLRSPAVVPINSAQLMWPNSDSCGTEEVTRQVHFLVDDDNDGDTEFLCKHEVDVAVDTNPPNAPALDSIDLNGGEGALVVEWALPSSGTEDIEFFQFLCARVDGTEVEADGFGKDAAEFTTANEVCGADDSIAMGLPADLPSSLASLSHGAVCGTAGGTETQIRIPGPENGVEYRVLMVVVDDARNGTVIDLGVAEPQPVRDFWEDYKEKGGDADGGVCLITATYGDNHPFAHAMRDFRDGELASTAFGSALTSAYYSLSDRIAPSIAADPTMRVMAQIALLPLVGLAWLWQSVGLAGLLGIAMLGWMWRRRRTLSTPGRRLALAAATGALLLLASMGNARAQSGYDPYWEAWDEDEASSLGPSVPMWNLELKIGPYLPAIDDGDFDLMNGEGAPFSETFRGDNMLLWAFELQRFFLFPEGQLGATLGVGFMGKSTNAYQVDGNGDVVRDANGEALRAPANKTRFRMMPMSLGAVYRFTMLDDRWGIPIVPYGKAGLSYYLWWIRSPSGDFARAQKDPMCDPAATSCATTRALGASLGYQGSLGLALRAERMDPTAATNLRNELGIEHANFFAELLYARVDHFGASDRLKVGDLTWLAGISFEF